MTVPSVYYRVLDTAGESAPWLTLVHGFSHHQGYFSAQVANFQADYRLLLVDFRGHGGSSAVPGPYGIEEYADDVLAALTAAGVDQTHYWGTHTGTAIGLVIAHRQPERLLSLVLESPVLPGFAMPEVTRLLNRARTIAQAEGVEAAKRDWFDHAGWFDYIRAHPKRCRARDHWELVQAFEAAPWLSPQQPRPVTPIADYLPTIPLPTLLYNGAADLSDFKQAAAALETGLPHVQRREIAEAGGFAGWENPQAVKAIVSQFLKERREPRKF
ncbi:MAG TPA: alpha/beta fold hydrolase [Phototrophicaceae bacterium]|nr:alpha/beta fold hydrolase [Phototrophicaceae bacterium]